MSHESDIHSHMGQKGSIKKIRSLLEQDHKMMQLMIGKGPNDSDVIFYVALDRSEFAMVTSPSGSSDYTIEYVGDVTFMHEKNLDRLAENN